MAKIVQKKLGWDPSPDADIQSYNVYWAIPPATVDYDSSKLNVGKVTEVNLPLAGMPNIDGNLTIGVAAVDDVGNISDISKATLPFDFQAPQPPGLPFLI